MTEGYAGLDQILGGKKYCVVPLAGDPFVRPARARLIWANNTAQAVENLGGNALLAGQVTRMPIKFEHANGLASARRMITNTYNVEASYELLGIHRLPGRFGEFSEEKWALNYDIPRYLFPKCGLLHTRDPQLLSRALKLDIPCIYEDHDEDHNKKFRDLPKLAATHANLRLVIAITEIVKNRLVEDGIPEDRIVVLDSGFNKAALSRDVRAVSVLRRRLLRDWEHLVVYAGGLQEERGIDHILQAAQSMPTTLFMLFGGNQADQDFWRQAAARARLSNILLPGYLPQREALKFQQAACAVVMTRRRDKRAGITSPLKFFEYMASGTAVVAAMIPAIERHASPDMALSTYRPKNPSELGEALRRSIDLFPWRPEGYRKNTDFAAQFTWEARQTTVFDYLSANHVRT